MVSGDSRSGGTLAADTARHWDRTPTASKDTTRSLSINPCGVIGIKWKPAGLGTPHRHF